MPKTDTISLLKSPLVKRIFLMFVICALLPVLSLTIVTYQQITRQMENDLAENLHQLSKNTGMSIFNTLSLVESELIGLSRLLGDAESSVVKNAYDFISDKEKETILALGIVNSTGEIRPVFGTLPDLRRWKLKGTSASSLYFTKTEKASTTRIFMAVPRLESSASREYLLAELSPEDIWVEPLRSVTDDTILSVLAPGESVLTTTAALPENAVSSTLNAAKASSLGFLEWRLNDKSYLASYWEVFLEGTFATENLIVLASKEKNLAGSAIQRFTYFFILITVLTFLLVLLISSIYVKKTLYPLAALSRGTRKIGKGDFKHQVVVESKDEFKDLADSFNVMTTRIDEHIEGLNQVSRIVRQILTSLDRKTLIKTVIDQLGCIVPTTQVIFAIFDPEQRNRLETHALKLRQEILPTESEVILDGEERETLKQITDYFLCNPRENLQNFFSHFEVEEKSLHLCLPLIQNNRLTGVIFLQLASEAPSPETLLRTRQVADQVAIALSNIYLIEELDLLNWGTLQALARTVDASSSWTAGHSERVTSLSQAIGQRLGLTDNEMDNLQRAALLHDIGKIGCPAALLDKPASLTDEEYKVLKQHPVLGAKILEPISIYRHIIPAIRHHHERYDGKGYPDGLDATQICRDARILTIADIFDALISHRPYRQGWPLEKVKSYLSENRGIIFDPDILDTFLTQVLPELDTDALQPQVHAFPEGMSSSG